MVNPFLGMVRDAGTYVTVMISIITLFTLIIPKTRSALVNWIMKTTNINDMNQVLEKLNSVAAAHNKFYKEIKETNVAQNEALCCMLRLDILRYYNKYKRQKTLPLYVKENVINFYESYKVLGGNGYIDKLYEEMIGWETE